MPVGYLIGSLFLAETTALALWPRPTRGPRPTAAYVLETAANENPFLLFYLLVASTVLAVAQGDVATPLGWVSLAVCVATTAGLAVVVARGLAARAALDGALASALGAHWRDALHPELATQIRPHWSIGRALVSPVRIPSPSVRRVRGLEYGPESHQRLDLYLRRSRPSDCPLLLYFHGGGFFSGGRSREARLLFDRLARHGWVCASADYRLGRGGTFPGNLVDAKRAIVWVRSHADEWGVDPGTLVVGGGSAGGFLAAMCALTVDEPAYQPKFEDADTAVVAAISLYGYYGPAPSVGGIAPSPGDLARPDAPPFLVVHGSHDPMVTAAMARDAVVRLRARSAAPAVYAELPGGQHAFDRFPSVRASAVADAIEGFTAWVRSTRPS